MADQSNTGRNILIVGALLGIAAAGIGAYVMSTAKATAPETQVQSGKSDTSLTAQAEKVKADLKSDRTITDAAPEGATINGKPRMAPLFYSTELWQVTLDDQQKNSVTDIYDAASQNIHGDVPNTWFITEGIADALGRADGLELDSDKDGFSNGEEFKAGTKPADPKSYPALVQVNATPKLEVKKVEVAKAFITYPAILEDNPSEVEIRVFNNEADMNPTYKTKVKVGGTFDLKEGDKTGRFTLVGFDKKNFDVGGTPMEEKVIKVHDNVTASPEKDFVIRAGKSTTPAKDRLSAKGHHISDTTVVFRVTGGPAAGQKGKDEVRAQLNGSFEIPGGYSDGKTMKATVQSVDAAGSANILVEGMESPVQVPAAPKTPKAPKK